MVKTVTCLAFMLAFAQEGCSWVVPLLPGRETESSEKIVESDIPFSLSTMHVAKGEEEEKPPRGIDESHPPSLLSLVDGPREER